MTKGSISKTERTGGRMDLRMEGRKDGRTDVCHTMTEAIRPFGADDLNKWGIHFYQFM